MPLLLLLLCLLPQDRPEVVKAPPKPELDAQKRFGEGVLQAKRGLYLDAVKSFEAALKLDPQALPPRRMLAQHYATVGRSDEALAMARELTERAPEDYTTWQLYANQLKEAARAKDAIAALTKATELDSATKSPDQLAQMLSHLSMWARDAGETTATANALRRYLTVLANNRERFRESEFLDDAAFADESAATHERLGEAMLKLDKPAEAVREFEAAREIFKDRTDTKAKLWGHRLHWHLARVHFAQKNYAAAREHLQEYLKHVTPGTIEPYQMLADILLEVDRENAGARLSAFAKSGDKNVPLQMLLAVTYARAGHESRADDILRELVKTEPRPEVYRALFQLYESTGQNRKALECIDVYGDKVDQPDLGEEPKKKAQEQLRAMNAALVKQPTLIVKLLHEAKQEKMERLRNNNFNYNTFNRLAYLISLTDQLDQAERIFRDALNDGGVGRFFTVSYDHALMRVLDRRHKYAEIKAICRDRLRNLNNVPNGNLNEFLYNAYYEDALMHLGEIDEALRVNEQTVIAAPNEAARVGTRLSRVEMLRQADRTTEALAECEKVLKEFPQPKHARTVRLKMSALLARSGKGAESEKLLRRMLDDDPNDVAVLNSLGFELADTSRNLDEAERLIRRALELDKRARRFGEGDEDEPASVDDEDRAGYLDSLAWVLFRKGKAGEARNILEKAVAQRDGRDEAVLWDHLGDIYYKLGELGKARAAWGSAKEYYAREPIAKKDGRLDEVARKLNVLK